MTEIPSPPAPPRLVVTIPIAGEETWCFYWHEMDETIIFCGVDRLSEVVTMSQARRNTEWVKMCVPGKNVKLYIKTISQNYRSLQSEQFAFFKFHRPVCNVVGKDITSGRGDIICEQDGRRFETQTEACIYYNILPSALSAHLRGIPGHRTCKGKTFRYASQ